MSANIYQIYVDFPIITNQSTDLMYFGRLPYSSVSNNVAMQFSDFAAQFGSPYTPAALTVNSDSNITLTLGGTPATSLLEAVSLTVTWSGLLPLNRGGTNANLTASNGGIVWSNATQFQILAGTTTANQVLLSGSSSSPSWSLATYPSSTTASQLLYSSSNNVITGLATGNNGVLITSVSGVPSISSTLPLAVQTNITELGTITTGIWNGSIISLQYGGTNANLTASNGGIVWSNASQLQILPGTTTANQILMSGSSSTPAWSTAVYPATTTINQLLYSSSANTITGLATGNNGVLVTSGIGTPSISSTLPIAVQTNITELGTVTVGAWNASLIPMAYGGTNANLTATVNNLVYSTASAMALLPTANNGVLVTSNLGVPSISSTLPNAVQINITAVGTIGAGIWEGSVINGQWGGTGVNNGSNTITIGGNLNFASSFTTSGAFAVTQTYTGITNVTFPTSGTLLTTTGITINGTANQIAVSGSSPTFTLSFPNTLYSSHNILDDGTGSMQISSTATNPSASSGALIFTGSSLSIGKSTAPLSGVASEINFGIAFAQRMISLHDVGSPGTDNQYQYYGLGITTNTLYYSIGATTGFHKFYAGNSSTTSKLLFTIGGDGSVLSANNILDDGSSNATISGTLDVGGDCTFNGLNFNFGPGLSGSPARVFLYGASSTPADCGNILFVKKGTTPTTAADSLGDIIFLGVDSAGASVEGSKISAVASANASATFIQCEYFFNFINPSGINVAPIQMNYQGIVLNGSLFTLNGSNNNVNFNFGGATNVTFPTSGTLATVGGTVASIVGTTNRITVNTVSGVATVDIASTYVGQSSITTLGTITTGTWLGTIIDASVGGTGLGLPVQQAMLIGKSGGSGYVFLSPPTAQQVLMSDVSGVVQWNSSLPLAVQFNISGLGTITVGIWNASTIAIAYGGTGVTSVTTSPVASAWAGWDTNKNLLANNFNSGYTTTATSAGTTTLTVSSTYQQYFTGSTTQTVVMPVTSTLALGQSWYIVNLSSGNVTIQSSGGNVIQILNAGSNALVTCISTSGTTAASWNCDFSQNGGASGTVSPGSINQLAWYAANGTVVSGLSTANNGVLVTSSGGVPSISSTLPSAVQGNITSVGTLTSGTWNAAVISGQYGGTGVANTGKTITIGGNVTFSGAFTFTGTLTGNTSITFPTSGTLLTTTGISIAGTANQITVSGTSPSFTLSFPSVLHTVNGNVLDDGSGNMSCNTLSTSSWVSVLASQGVFWHKSTSGNAFNVFSSDTGGLSFRDSVQANTPLAIAATTGAVTTLHNTLDNGTTGAASFAGPVTLPGNATSGLQAVPLQQLTATGLAVNIAQHTYAGGF